MKNYLLLCCSFLFSFSFAQKTTNYYYEKNSIELNETQKKLLFSKINELTDKHSEYLIELRAYTDNTGSADYNKIISEKRCEKVKELLSNQGFVVSQISSYPIGMIEENNESNRFIQIAFISKKLPFEQLFNFSIKAQKHQFDPTKDFIFVANSGSVLKIPANSLVTPKGNLATEKVELSLTEYRNPSDFMVSNIPMNFKDDFFQSGGMFDLQINDSQGNNLKLKDGNSIDMQMSLADTSTSFEFYIFDKESKKWTEDSQNKISSTTWKTQTLNETILEMRSESKMIKYDNCPAITNNPLSLLYKAKKATEKSLEQYPESTMANLIYMNERYKNMNYAQTILKNNNYNRDSLFTIFIKKENNDFISLHGLKNFPELNSFTKLKIKAPNLPDNLLTQKWCDIQIRQGHRYVNNDYTIELKGDSSFTKIIVECFFPEELKSTKNFEEENTARHKHQKLFEQYDRDLKEKEHLFNQTINQKKQLFCDNRVIFELSITDNRDCFWDFIRPYISQEELKNGKYNWFKYAFDKREGLNNKLDSLISIYEKDQQLALSQRMILDNKALLDYKKLAFASTTISTQTFNFTGTYQPINITTLGLCNVDRLNLYLAKDKLIKPTYLVNGKELVIETIFVIDNQYNSILKLEENNKNKETRPSSFRISSKNQTKFVALDRKGNTYYLSGTQTNWEQIDENPIFEVEEIELNNLVEVNKILLFQ